MYILLYYFHSCCFADSGANVESHVVLCPTCGEATQFSNGKVAAADQWLRELCLTDKCVEDGLRLYAGTAPHAVDDVTTVAPQPAVLGSDNNEEAEDDSIGTAEKKAFIVKFLEQLIDDSNDAESDDLMESFDLEDIDES